MLIEAHLLAFIGTWKEFYCKIRLNLMKNFAENSSKQISEIVVNITKIFYRVLLNIL